MVSNNGPYHDVGRWLLSDEVCSESLFKIQRPDEDRPRSMRGGDLHWLWKPYEIYEQIDYARAFIFADARRAHLVILRCTE